MIRCGFGCAGHPDDLLLLARVEDDTLENLELVDALEFETRMAVKCSLRRPFEQERGGNHRSSIEYVILHRRKSIDREGQRWPCLHRGVSVGCSGGGGRCGSFHLLESTRGAVVEVGDLLHRFGDRTQRCQDDGLSGAQRFHLLDEETSALSKGNQFDSFLMKYRP